MNKEITNSIDRIGNVEGRKLFCVQIGEAKDIVEVHENFIIPLRMRRNGSNEDIPAVLDQLRRLDGKEESKIKLNKKFYAIFGDE